MAGEQAHVLFLPSVSGCEWVVRMLPGRSPAELPIAGRRLLDFQVEHAIKSGASSVRIVDHFGTRALEKEFDDTNTKGYEAKYEIATGPMPHGLDDIDELFHNGIPDGLCVVWGLCLSSHKLEDARYEPLSESRCMRTRPGFYQWRGGKWYALHPRGIRLRSPKVWLRVNMAVLHEPSMFTLPGYSAERGVYLGRNVVMEHGTEVKPPVILQDNVWCARLVRLDGDVIIGRGSYVAEGAKLKRTVIGADTFVGHGLDLEDKIVVGRRIVDANTGTWTDIDEPGLVRGISGSLGIFGAILTQIKKFLIGASHWGHG